MQFSQAQFAAAKTAAANSPRWIRAIERAAEALASGELAVTLLHNGALVTSPRGSYFVNGHCACPAVLITLQRRARSRVFFAPEKFVGRSEESATHELALNPDHFGRTDEAILSTPVHEMAHVWQDLASIASDLSAKADNPDFVREKAEELR